jgi:CheY-like chemotaxis protein
MPTLASVLLVDDDPTTNYLNKLLLTRMGAAEQVLVAENGEQALRTLVQTCVAEPTICPQLILLDMNMPVLNGLGFLEAYAQLPLVPQRPIVIVMLTTSLHPVDQTRAEQMPIAGFLTKPLTKEKVTAIVAQHFA